MKISAARQSAFAILLRIENDFAFSSILLEQAARNLSPIDRSLCHALVLGTLRKQIWLDHVIDTIAKNKRLDIEVRISLRLGLFQLYFLERVPAYSAINESVQLAQFAGKTSAKGLVNAVLRRAQRGVEVTPPDDAVEALSLATSHPRWLIEKWIGQFGIDETTHLAAANNEIPLTAFRTTAASTGAAVDVVAASRASEFTNGCFFADGVDERLLQLAAANEIYFQDEASQMAANVVHVEGVGRILDVCAAPGSKTTLIEKRRTDSGSGAFMVAGDKYPGRLRILQSNCAAQAVSQVAIAQYDAEETLPFADETFDSVMVDSPCSGTGTLRHNPEIRYRLSPDDFGSLAGKQLLILRNASKVIARAGILIYSTCSLEYEENELVCREFLYSDDRFEIIQPVLSERFITRDGFARTFPHRDKMDGFFIAIFRRK